MHKALKNRAGQINRDRKQKEAARGRGEWGMGVTANGTRLLYGVKMF